VKLCGISSDPDLAAVESLLLGVHAYLAGSAAVLPGHAPSDRRLSMGGAAPFCSRRVATRCANMFSWQRRLLGEDCIAASLLFWPSHFRRSRSLLAENSAGARASSRIDHPAAPRARIAVTFPPQLCDTPAVIHFHPP
jgi:hypothetical protein